MIPKILTCPDCKWHGANVTIENGTVQCPTCKRLVFRFLEPDEAFDKATFMDLLNGKRGKAAAISAAPFFPGTPQRMRTVVAGAFVGFVWQHIYNAYRAEIPNDESASS